MPSRHEKPSKPCVVCGRRIEWRKKWERDWDEVKYCSDACRGRKLGPRDHALEAAIVDLLGERPGKSICPSDAAKRVAAAEREPEWRDFMEPVRRAARRLVARGEAIITQGGREVDPSTAKGPIRIARPF